MPPAVVSFVLAASSLLQASPPPAERLDTSGKLLMACSIGSVLTLVIWCYRQVLSQPRPRADSPERDT